MQVRLIAHENCIGGPRERGPLFYADLELSNGDSRWTYHAKYPPFRVPIDQVFLSPTARILGLERLKPAGSDHFAITTSFYLKGQEPSTPEPEGNDLEQAEKMIDEGQRDAEQEIEKPS